VPKSRHRYAIYRNAGIACLNVDLNSLKTSLHFALNNRLVVFGLNATIFLDFSGHRAMKKPQEETIEPVADRLIDLRNLPPGIRG